MINPNVRPLLLFTWALSAGCESAALAPPAEVEVDDCDSAERACPSAPPPECSPVSRESCFVDPRFDAPTEWYTPRFEDTEGGLINKRVSDTQGHWETFDLDGDGRVELVSFARLPEGVQHGFPSDPHWLVYANTGARFASTASRWPTPTGFGGERGLYKRGPIGRLEAAWATLDLTGDGRPDLVSFAPDAGGAQHGMDDRPHWKVYPSSGAGFETEPIEWPTPRFPNASRGVHALGHSARGEGAWGTFDIDGDGRPDLVNFCYDERQGQHGLGSAPHWKVYLNSGTGFDVQASEWSTPALGNPVRGVWMQTMAEPLWGHWNTFDLTGDGRPDLVSFAGADNSGQHGLGDQPHWELYENAGEGFARAARVWATPRRADRGFDQDAHSSFTFGSWSTFDIDGDSAPDLVQFAPKGTGGQYGMETRAPHWRVFHNRSDSFDVEPTIYDTPTSDVGSLGVYRESLVSPDRGAWSTFDLDGDGRPDIVNFAPAGTGTQFGWDGETFWRVFRNLAGRR